MEAKNAGTKRDGVFRFPPLLSWAQKSTVWLEFLELVVIGFVIGTVVQMTNAGDKAYSGSWFAGASVALLVFMWWKFSRWWWSVRLLRIVGIVVSCGIGYLLYAGVLYPMVWKLTSLNHRYVLKHFYTGDSDLSLVVYDPFESPRWWIALWYGPEGTS
jgi:hypothetical protein